MPLLMDRCLHIELCINDLSLLGNNLEKALKKIKREDVVQKCMYNIMTVTDTSEREAAKLQLDQSGNSCSQWNNAHIS